MFEAAIIEMNPHIERDLGEQPIAGIMKNHSLTAHDLVANSTDQITHKRISRACKGRRLTPHVKLKILDAVNRTTGKTYAIRDLFNY